MKYIYKSIPFVGQVESLSPSTVADQLTNLINVNAKSGWDFYQINSVNIAVSPGCLASLFGKESFEKKYDMLIFRKEYQEGENSKLNETRGTDVSDSELMNKATADKDYFLG